jgi:PH (Pleckstrin Homology) domain-containing protein
VDATRPRSFKLGPESIVYAVFAGIFALLGIVWAVESETAGHLRLGLLMLAGAWSVAAFLGLRMARLGVFIDAEGIRVRNPFSTLTIPWRAIRGFTLTRSLIGDFGIAELHNGRHVRLWAIQPGSRVTSMRDRRAQLAIGTLNVELQDARARGSSPVRRDQRAPQMPQGAPTAERT